ncbi:hypothetical protein [Streptomyces sp. Edi2]|uniref:hypothetical protein n=1 Tax=Streptomyces sp. Edi2 TaxID=3162528 RepID=UPI003305AF63
MGANSKNSSKPPSSDGLAKRAAARPPGYDGARALGPCQRDRYARPHRGSGRPAGGRRRIGLKQSARNDAEGDVSSHAAGHLTAEVVGCAVGLHGRSALGRGQASLDRDRIRVLGSRVAQGVGRGPSGCPAHREAAMCPSSKR